MAYAECFYGGAHKHVSLAQLQHTGTQFTCFAGTKVQMLTARAAACCSSSNIATRTPDDTSRVALSACATLRRLSFRRATCSAVSVKALLRVR